LRTHFDQLQSSLQLCVLCDSLKTRGVPYYATKRYLCRFVVSDVKSFSTHICSTHFFTCAYCPTALRWGEISDHLKSCDKFGTDIGPIPSTLPVPVSTPTKKSGRKWGKKKNKISEKTVKPEVKLEIKPEVKPKPKTHGKNQEEKMETTPEIKTEENLEEKPKTKILVLPTEEKLVEKEPEVIEAVVSLECRNFLGGFLGSVLGGSELHFIWKKS